MHRALNDLYKICNVIQDDGHGARANNPHYNKIYTLHKVQYFIWTERFDDVSDTVCISSRINISCVCEKCSPVYCRVALFTVNQGFIVEKDSSVDFQNYIITF